MRKNKAAALLISIVFCLILVISIGFIIADSQHQCVGADCEICMQINSCKQLIRNIGYVGGISAFYAAFVCSFATIIIFAYHCILSFCTPISLKVKIIG